MGFFRKQVFLIFFSFYIWFIYHHFFIFNFFIFVLFYFSLHFFLEKNIEFYFFTHRIFITIHGLLILFFCFYLYFFVIFLFTFKKKTIIQRLRKMCFIVAIVTLFYSYTTLRISLTPYMFLLIHMIFTTIYYM